MDRARCQAVVACKRKGYGQVAHLSGYIAQHSKDILLMKGATNASV